MDKQPIIDLCRQRLDARKREYAAEMASLDAAAAEETKSSAGDKYETGREMIAQSRKVIESNWAETEAGLAALDRMAAAPRAERAAFGSLLETTLGWFLVGAGLGETEIGGITVRTLSLASPLGTALRGKAPGEKIPWRGATLEILRIAA